MKLLILGAAGFIGNACYDFFSKSNEIIGIDLADPFSKGLLIAGTPELLRVTLLANHFDVIINCAGSANIQKSFTEPQKDFELNTVLVQSVLTHIKEICPDTRFINISSAAVYGNPEQLPVKETDDLAPISPYGIHKLLSEKLMSDYYRLFKIKSLSVRIFSAYGKGLKQQLFYDLYQKLTSHSKQIELFGSGNESRDFIYISDITAALEVLIKKATFEGESYNLAGGKECKVNETVKLFSGLLEYHGKIVFSGKELPGYPVNWKADIQKIKALGYEPAITLEEGLKSYIKWLQAEQKS